MKDRADNLIKSHDVIGLGVFSVAEGQKLGIVKEIFFKPGEKSPLFLIEDDEWYKGGKVIKSSDVMKIGEDALVIESKGKMEHFSTVPDIESMLRNTDLASISVINSAEKKLGKLKGYFIDRDKVEVASLEVQNGGTEPKYWAAEKISGVKDGAVVVSDEEQSDGAVVETEEAEPEGLIKEEVRGERPEVSVEGPEQTEEEKVAPTGGHPEEAVARREDVSKKASSGNGEAKEEKVATSVSHPEEAAGRREDLSKADVEDTGVTELSAPHKDLKQILEERQDKFLMGKKVDRDITADDGTIIVKKGEIITKEVLEEAKKAHKYIVLSFCVKTDLIKRS